MSNQDNQQPPYDVNDVVNNLVDTNARLNFENAELRAIIQKMEKQQAEQNKNKA